MDYLYYVLAVLVLGLACINIVRFATRSQNPDLLKHYKTRRSTAMPMQPAQPAKQSQRSVRSHGAGNTAGLPAIKSLRQRHHEKLHHRTPWGWPGAQQSVEPQGISETVRKFTDRLVKEKQLAQPGSSGSIRALLEDRYRPANREMTEIPYQKVKRPLLRDPSEQFDQMDNLGKAESRRLRQKLQFLSAMNADTDEQGDTNKNRSKVEFRYVELKDLKQPWGW